MITKDAVMAKAQDLKAKASQELKDLDVDRVDGVDRPATGRNFLLFKGEGNVPAADVLRLRAEAAKLKGMKEATRKAGLFSDIMIPDATREYPLEVQEDRTGPRTHDDGVDRLGRDYWDGAFDRLAGFNGKGSSAETGLPDGEQENFAADQGGELVSPPSTYECEEVGEGVAVRVGPNFVMSPQASGIATPLNFRKPEPATVVKRVAGLFKSVVLDPMAGPSRTSSFFDEMRDDSKVVKDGGSIFRNVVGWPGE